MPSSDVAHLGDTCVFACAHYHEYERGAIVAANVSVTCRHYKLDQYAHSMAHFHQPPKIEILLNNFKVQFYIYKPDTYILTER